MKKVGNFILGLGSVILLVVLTLALIVKQEFKPETIKEALVDTDFSFILDSMDEEDKEILEGVEEALTYIGIPDKIVDKLLNSSGTKNFVGVYISNTVDYFLDNDNSTPLTGKDLEDLIKSNLDIIQSGLPSKDKEFLEEYENNIYKFIRENEKDILSFFPEPKEVFKDVDLNEIELSNNVTLKDVTSFISFFTGLPFVLTLAGSIILLLGIIVLINLKTKKYLPVIANTFFTYFILVLVMQGAIYLVLKGLGSEFPTLNVFINNMTNYLWVGIGVSLVLSIILRVVYVNVKNKKVK